MMQCWICVAGQIIGNDGCNDIDSVDGGGVGLLMSGVGTGIAVSVVEMDEGTLSFRLMLNVSCCGT